MPHTNRLANETSPYLLQHAHNPVDWYPWGPEAFQAAREQDKPIFLSVGYSTCYWCHVMERQCFESERVAQVMNELFISIKVDREERPDVDALYMNAVQILTRQGGWPMSVFLTPDLKPFWGGTYFPPDDLYGRPGFVSILHGISEAWHQRRHEVIESAQQLAHILQQIAQPPAPDAPLILDEDWLRQRVMESVADYDVEHGGFGHAPKFPRQTLLEFLLVYLSTLESHPALGSARRDSRSLKLLQMIRHTLDAMAAGGIRDHLGGGFHRYSTDARWLVPHFEIMLYDNAMLAWIYTEAYRQTEHLPYAKVARGICDFVLREMRSPHGAFYTAFDAEVDAREGQSCLWTADEIRTLLGPEDAAIFNHVYGVDRGPNFADPHHGTGQPDQNILYLPQPLEAALAALQRDHADLTLEQLEQRLEKMRQTLYAARRRRRQPLLDTKILTGWNAMMIRALAHAGEILAEPRYLNAASVAADYLLRHQRLPDGTLLRVTRPEPPRGGRFGEAPAPDSRSAAASASQSASAPLTAEEQDAEHAVRLVHRLTSPEGSETPPAASAPMPHDVPAEPSKPIPASLEDYALLIQALIALRQATGREVWKDHAASLAMVMIERFADEQAGGFFSTDHQTSDLIVRQKIGTDSPLPSGNAAAAMALMELGSHERARRTIEVFAQQITDHAPAASAMLQAATLYIRRFGPIEVAPGDTAAPHPPSPQQIADEVVTLSAEWASPTQLNLVADIRESFHINAHPAGEGLVATRVAVMDDAAGAVESIDYPPGQRQQFPFAQEPIDVYSRRVVFAIRFNQAGMQDRSLRVSIHYQACDDQACLPPVTKVIDVRPTR